ncbi:glycine-rich domain-containing protein [Mycolicibacterium stellerae]|uniref:glycine-rich domain-containing protein n=1 Tax=Mycolicibacterium stellerae TaxID=2358193 RepID=UPI0013DE4604|nr:hypothetical protein [Mycolicibacterium stellerae]
MTAPTEQLSVDAERNGLSPAYTAALRFEAPYVIEKLVKNRTADSDAEAQMLFREAKRYLVLAQSDRSTAWQMHSLRVDEAWHQFVLFTFQYADFCERHFGRFVHHAPSNSPSSGASSSVRRAAFGEFQARYLDLFGDELPSVWFDAETLTEDRRLVNERVGALTVRDADDMVELVAADGTVLFRVSELARSALMFASTTGAFHVRELPGGLTGEERAGLARALVAARLLRVCG